MRGQRVEILEDKNNHAVARGSRSSASHLADGFAMQPVVPALARSETTDQIHEGRFARSGGPITATHSPSQMVTVRSRTARTSSSPITWVLLSPRFRSKPCTACTLALPKTACAARPPARLWPPLSVSPGADDHLVTLFQAPPEHFAPGTVAPGRNSTGCGLPSPGNT